MNENEKKQENEQKQKLPYEGIWIEIIDLSDEPDFFTTSNGCADGTSVDRD